MFDYSSVDLEGILQRLHGQMNELQRRAVGKGRASSRVIYGMWMGTGKTLAALATGLCFRPQVWLIIGTKGSTTAFQQDIQKWLPEFSDPSLFKVVQGTQYERQQAYRTPALFYATTSAAFIRDVEWLSNHKVKVDCITIDEAQKLGYRNHRSETVKKTKALIKATEKHLGRRVKLINFLSGSWTSKGPPQQFGVLNILAPKEFTSYWKHVYAYTHTVKTTFGTEVLGPKNTQALAQVTSPYVYIVTKEEAEKFLPPLRRQRLVGSLPAKIQEHYNTLENDMYANFDDQLISVTTILAAKMKLRQLVCCPQMIHPSLGVGPALELCVDKMEEYDELPNWRHNIVFTPFLDSIPIFREYLQDRLKLRPNQILIAKGGMGIEELQELQTNFRRDPQTLILASLLFSQSWNAETALNVYFPHFEWDQDANQQAEARSRRADGKQPLIMSFYAHFPGSVTEDIFDILNRKTNLNNLTYNAFREMAEKARQRYEQQKRKINVLQK